MGSSYDTAIIVPVKYDMYAGEKSDASVGSVHLDRLLYSCGLRFSVSTWNLFEIALRDSRVY
jgi:hypothetical protein